MNLKRLALVGWFHGFVAWLFYWAHTFLVPNGSNALAVHFTHYTPWLRTDDGMLLLGLLLVGLLYYGWGDVGK